MRDKIEFTKDKAIFTVSVNDGYCEWSYPLLISNEMSIYAVMEILCAALNIEVPEGKKIRR